MTTPNDVSNAAARDRYTRVAMALHWAIAAFIAFNLLTGFVMETMKFPARFLPLMLHASSGLTVLALTVLRVVWRLLNPPPPHPAGMKPLERHASHFAHFLLYAGMVLLPLTGWGVLSAHAPPGSRGAAAEFAGPTSAMPAMPPGAQPGGAPPVGPKPPLLPPGGPPPPLQVWGLFTLPMIGPIEAIGTEPGGLAPLRVLHDQLADWHTTGVWLMIALLILHVLGALKHQYVDKQPSLERMGVGRRTKS